MREVPGRHHGDSSGREQEEGHAKTKNMSRPRRVINYPPTSVRSATIEAELCPSVYQRFKGFLLRKVQRLERFISQTVPREDLMSGKSSEEPFLELDVTFDPPNSQLLLYYFISLAFQRKLGLTVDFNEIQSLIEKGGDINATDNLGQTVLHDSCREFDTATCEFLIDKGARINAKDRYGRTPLHIAAAYDNHEIIPMLVDRGAKMTALTHGEMQTPLHHAARNDSGNACSMLAECGADIEARDYRGRTPLLLAADLDRSVSANALLDVGACGRAMDYTGYHATCAMISKMPTVAEKALNQFHKINRTLRQEFFWLNFLEPSLISNAEDTQAGYTVLEEVVRAQNQDLVKHPMIKEMIATKWNQFGLFGVIYDISIYVLTLVAWSILVLIRPLGSTIDDITPFHMFIETASLSFYAIQVYDEIIEARIGHAKHKRWLRWKKRHAQQDLQYVIPKNQNERSFLESMIEDIEGTKSFYLSDYWNIYDWCSLSLMGFTALVYTFCRIAETIGYKELFMAMDLSKSRLLSLSLTLSWFKLFKYVRVFKTIGPFVVIITNSLGDCLKIAFVYFVLYVPMVCVFYQFYGQSDVVAYADVPTAMFTVFRMIVVDDYSYYRLLEWGDEKGLGRWWIHILVAYWILVSSIVLLNLFIALMSDTFQRVYDNAVEVAALERAQNIVNLEWKLRDEKRATFLEYIRKNFSPKVNFYDDDPTNPGDGEIHGLTLMTKRINEQVKSLGSIIVDLKEKETLQKELYSTLERSIIEQSHVLKDLLNQVKILTDAQLKPENPQNYRLYYPGPDTTTQEEASVSSRSLAGSPTLGHLVSPSSYSFSEEAATHLDEAIRQMHPRPITPPQSCSTSGQRPSGITQSPRVAINRSPNISVDEVFNDPETHDGTPRCSSISTDKSSLYETALSQHPRSSVSEATPQDMSYRTAEWCPTDMYREQCNLRPGNTSSSSSRSSLLLSSHHHHHPSPFVHHRRMGTTSPTLDPQSSSRPRFRSTPTLHSPMPSPLHRRAGSPNLSARKPLWRASSLRRK